MIKKTGFRHLLKLFYAKIFYKNIAIVILLFFFLLLKILTRLEIEGQENIKEVEDGPLIFASNHSSYIDSGISAAAMPKNGVF